MSKLRLDLDTIAVETFATTPQREQGSVVAFATEFQTRCAMTCNLDTTCQGNTDYDNMCTGDCTGLGVFCYTADPKFYDCTGGGACTGGAGCTNTTCTIDNVTCVGCTDTM